MPLRGMRVALLQAGAGDIREVLDRGCAGWHIRFGQLQPAELQLHAAALGQQLGVGHRLRQICVLLQHVRLVGQVVVLPFEAEALLFVAGRVGADAEQQVVRVVVARLAVVRVLRGDQRNVQVARQLDGAL